MQRDLRLPALRRFATAITILNLLGHTVLGFEQSWAHLAVALLAAYATELLLETVTCWAMGRKPRFLGNGFRAFVDFMLSAHITGCAVAMLLYANSRVMAVAFAAAMAIASKTLFRAPAAGGSRHFLNPSNFGITVTLLVFPWVGIAPPYQFTEELRGIGDWILPGLIVLSGSFLNGKFTRKLPLIAGWLGGFVLQAAARSLMTGAAFEAALLPMTGVAFILFTFYMVTDPATTPVAPRAQMVFGACVALAYGVLVAQHVVFGLFFALTAVTLGRGVMMFATALLASRRARLAHEPVPLPLALGRTEG